MATWCATGKFSNFVNFPADSKMFENFPADSKNVAGKFQKKIEFCFRPTYP
jgi:hypothetical protein